MAPKKKKIIKKRRIAKADVKRIPKMPMPKPNINLSPYDIANMVQQRFKQDMEADNNKIKRRQVELQAERNAIQSPEFKKTLDEHTKSLMSLQQELATQKDEMRRAQVDSQREFQRSPEFRQMMEEWVSVRRHIEHSEEMRKAESEKIVSEIDRQIQSSQEAYNQRLEKAIVEHETRNREEMNKLEERRAQVIAEGFAITQDSTQRLEKAVLEQQIKQQKQINELNEKWQDETATFEAQTTEKERENRVEGYKRTQGKRRDLALDRAKAKVNAELLDEQIEIQKQVNENTKRQAYLEQLETQGAADAKEVGEKRARQELEKIRLDRAIEFERQRQKSLLDNEIVAKESQKIITDLQGQIQAIKSSDPNSRLTGDPALIEVDLFMLGEEQEKYKEAQRKLAETRYHQHAMQNLNKEVDELAKAIRDSGQGIEFSQLYGKDPSAIVGAMRDLVELKQGRKILTENLPSIFPSLQTRLIEIEQRSQQLASREQSITSREQKMDEIDDQQREAKILIQRQDQQIAEYQQQLAAYQQSNE